MLTSELLHEALGLLGERLEFAGSAGYRLVICGGAALIITDLVTRTTKDLDVLAMLDESLNLCDPNPLPEDLSTCIQQVAVDLNLPADWINNGPSQGEGGLFAMGLPEGLCERLIKYKYGQKLSVHFIGRLDQIYLKLYAAADRGGYHITDLLLLEPTDSEIYAAALWSMAHDVSEGYRMVVKNMLKQIGYEDVAEKL